MKENNMNSKSNVNKKEKFKLNKDPKKSLKPLIISLPNQIKPLSNNKSNDTTNKRKNLKKNKLNNISNDNNSLKWLESPNKSIELIENNDEMNWYAKLDSIEWLNDDSSLYICNADELAKVESTINEYYRNITKFDNKNNNKLSSDQKWINKVISSGTLSDKIAGLALKIQQSPIKELETFDILITLASNKEQRPAQLAIDSIKDLLISNLLPERYLVSLAFRPLKHPNISFDIAILLWYENQLLTRINKIVKVIENNLKSLLDYNKRSNLLIVQQLLIHKSQNESELLTLLVNKLGDPSPKISNYVVTLLNEIIYKHPNMRIVIIREIRQFMLYPKLSPKVIYICILFLTQITITSSDNDIVIQLLDVYINLFERILKYDELKSKLLSALLVGINRSFPYIQDKKQLNRYVDILFKLVHNSSFATSTQALVLISHIILDNNNSENSVDNELTNRFYRALYGTLLTDQIYQRNRNTIYLNLLYRSIKQDPIQIRVMAFLKRLALMLVHCPSPIVGGILYLISEILKVKKELKSIFNDLITNNEIKSNEAIDNDTDRYDPILNNYDPNKREPIYALSSNQIELWEYSLLSNHYHPSIQSFYTSLVNQSNRNEIIYKNDPTIDFTLISFLNRFAYKNPKKKGITNIQNTNATNRINRRNDESDIIVNSEVFKSMNANTIDPSIKFFYKFFNQRDELRLVGKSKVKSKKHDDNSDGESNIDETDEIDDYADQLMNNYMNEVDRSHGLVDVDDANDDDEKFINNELSKQFQNNEYDIIDDDDNDDDSSLGGNDDDFHNHSNESISELDNYMNTHYNNNIDNKTKNKNTKSHRNQEKEDSDDDLEAIEFDDKPNKKKSKKSNEVVFADADSYEQEMDDIIKQINQTRNQTNEKITNNNKSKKSVKVKK